MPIQRIHGTLAFAGIINVITRIKDTGKGDTAGRTEVLLTAFRSNVFTKIPAFINAFKVLVRIVAIDLALVLVVAVFQGNLVSDKFVVSDAAEENFFADALL